MKNKIKYILAGTAAMFIAAALSGCIKEYGPAGTSADGSVKLHLKLNIPGLSPASRAMSDSDETAIDYGSVQILLFEETQSGDLFRQKAVITGQAPPVITVRVPQGSGAQRFRMVVIANMPVATIPAGTEKTTALSQYIFGLSGRWATSPAAVIPMWGETATFEITGDSSLGINMHRALARVDVGTLFRFNNPDPVTGEPYEDADTDKESVWGLDNFTISEVLVYRTVNQAYAATTADRMSGNEAIAPNIPSTAMFNSESGTPMSSLPDADQNPLEYTLTAPAASHVREIYIPESALITASSNMDNVPCIVVGGYYGAGNVSDVTYYRADFATYANGAVVAYRPVLRNHRYVFDIRSVSGPGAPTPEEALDAVDNQLDLNIVEWNEVPLSFYSNLHYYMELSDRTVVLDPQIRPGSDANSRTITYSTDLLLDGGTSERTITYTWSDGATTNEFFDAVIDYSTQTITITALQENTGIGAATRSDVLTLRVRDLSIDIYVYQTAFNLAYDIDCSSIVVNGRYIEGTALDYSNYISLTVTSDTDLSGGLYEVRSILKNGIYFLDEGYFPSVAPVGGVYSYPLELQGYGTLTNESGEPVLLSFDIDIVTNSTTGSFCTATIPAAFRTKKILAIGANAIYVDGYMLEPGSASRAMVDASVNFGPTVGSTVTMATNAAGKAFTIMVMTAGSGMTGEVINYADLLNNLNTFQPDIILTGQAINYFTPVGNTNVIELLGQFVDAGGAFLMFNEYYPSAPSVAAMVSRIAGTTLSGNNQAVSGTNQLISLLPTDTGNPVMVGPFGDLIGTQWGSDGHELYGFASVPAEAVIYSRRNDNAVCSFSLPDKGFFFVGDGGFLSNAQRYIGGAYTGSYIYYPFAIDAQYRPIPRTNYTSARSSVYNSQFFGNILTWAVDYSERNGIAYEEGVPMFPRP